MKKITSSVYDLHGSISADGKRMAFVSERSGNREIWIKDLDTDGKARALTNTQAAEGYPIISPDGSKVVYRVIEDTWQPIYMVSATGGVPEKVCADCGFPTDWSPDGAQVLFEPGATAPAIWLLDLATRKTREVYKDKTFGLHSPRFSRDGRWVVFHGREEGKRGRLFVAPFPRYRGAGRQEWIPVTGEAQPAHNACWSPDGNILYFLSERDGFRCIWGQKLHPRSRHPDGQPFAVRHFHTARMSLLMNVKANPDQVRLSVVRNRLTFTLDELLGNIWMARL